MTEVTEFVTLIAPLTTPTAYSTIFGDWSLVTCDFPCSRSSGVDRLCVIFNKRSDCSLRGQWAKIFNYSISICIDWSNSGRSKKAVLWKYCIKVKSDNAILMAAADAVYYLQLDTLSSPSIHKTGLCLPYQNIYNLVFMPSTVSILPANNNNPINLCILYH